MPDPAPSTRELVFRILRERPMTRDVEIARALGVSRQRVLQIRTLSRDGPIEPNRPKVSPEVIVETYERLRHLRGTALELGISVTTARRALTRAMIPTPRPGPRQDMDPTTALLVREVRAGRILREAAATLGMRYTTAKQRIRRAHLRINPDPPVPPEEVVSRYRAGASQGELADYYGVAPITIARWLRRAGEPLRSSAAVHGMILARRPPPADQVTSARSTPFLDDPAAMVAALPDRKQLDLVMETWKPVEEDEDNLPPHLRKMLTTTGDVG